MPTEPFSLQCLCRCEPMQNHIGRNSSVYTSVIIGVNHLWFSHLEKDLLKKWEHVEPTTGWFILVDILVVHALKGQNHQVADCKCCPLSKSSPAIRNGWAPGQSVQWVVGSLVTHSSQLGSVIMAMAMLLLKLKLVGYCALYLWPNLQMDSVTIHCTISWSENPWVNTLRYIISNLAIEHLHNGCTCCTSYCIYRHLDKDSLHTVTVCRLWIEVLTQKSFQFSSQLLLQSPCRGDWIAMLHWHNPEDTQGMSNKSSSPKK